MGFFHKDMAADESEHGKPEMTGRKEKGVQIMENVRKADGSMVQEPVTDFYDEKEQDEMPPLKSEILSEKAGFSDHAYSVSPTREDSFGSFSFPRKQSMMMVTEMPHVDEYEASEGSFINRKKWRSSRLQPGEKYEKPWKKDKDPRRKWEKIIFGAGCACGALLGAWLMYTSYTNVTNSEYCIIMDDNFTSIDDSVWNYEIERGGFGTGSFEWTTNDPENVYTDAEGLHIVPTLTNLTSFFNSAMIEDGSVLNLTADGTCTSGVASNCQVIANSSSGDIINPVRSARINTKNKRAIRYGKVEVVAKLPAGDWIWPAIWMMPQDNVYGQWPMSGEIDIMESRGNYPGLPSGGRDQVSSTLHWGPNQHSDAYWRTLGLSSLRRTDFSEEYHTFGLEWSDKYMFMYQDSRLLQVLFLKWNKGSTMWNKGKFGANTNQSALNDPWTWTGRPNTPFDQEFYLILNVAVGGTNGFFVDGEGNKPWVDASDAAPRAFWDAVGSWYPSWGQGAEKGMTVKSVKMWSLGACPLR